MKSFVWALALTLLGYSVADGVSQAKVHTLIVTGMSEGYLSPCGCVKPMSGGIRRRNTAVKELAIGGKATLIDTGAFVAGTGRQDEMKAEAVAESLGLLKVAAVNYGLEEARLGAGMAQSLERLCGHALIASGIDDASIPTKRFKASGPFLIGGVDPRTQEVGRAINVSVQPIGATIEALLEEAKASGLVPVLMTRGDAAHAEALARSHPGLRLIACNAKSQPFEAPRKVGETLIVSPGEHGKSLVKIDWDGEKFTGYRAVDLGPEFADDKDAQGVFSAYLGRVTREDLLSMVPRTETDAFAGSKACATCHVKESKVWKESSHSHALATLEKEGQDRDPDCTYCHVVGLKSTQGFKARTSTPNLADVGCESCHGPSKAHTMNPAKNKLPKVGRESCMPCHNTEHSPTFNFDEYWKKIAH